MYRSDQLCYKISKVKTPPPSQNMKVFEALVHRWPIFKMSCNTLFKLSHQYNYPNRFKLCMLDCFYTYVLFQSCFTHFETIWVIVKFQQDFSKNKLIIR